MSRRIRSRRFGRARPASGGVTPLPPTSVDVANLTAGWSGAQGFAGGGSLGSGVFTSWTSADGSSKVLTAVAGPTSATSLNGHLSVDFNGSSQYFNAAANVIADMLGAGSWTVISVQKDTGSPADSGNYFANAGLLTSGTDGRFAIGTTATQVFAGQGDPGAGATYDILAQSGSAIHVNAMQYDSGAGKVSLAKDGGALSAGTTVAAIGASAGVPTIGKSGVLAVFFKGSLGELWCWKSKLTTGQIASVVAYFQAAYA